jgi:putative ABC transport system substrate-binding protein
MSTGASSLRCSAAWRRGRSRRAQQPAMPVIGFVNGASREGYAPFLSAFHQGLRETGYVEGQNIAIEYRWADGQYDRLPAMVGDLVQRKMAVIVATGTPANLTAKTATAEIPVVFTTSSDPVKLGLVRSLNQPDGNVTGAVQMNVEVMPKLMELVHECIPTATTMLQVIPIAPRPCGEMHKLQPSIAGANSLPQQRSAMRCRRS